MMLVSAKLTANEAEMVTALRRAREEMARLRQGARQGAQGTDEFTRSTRATEAAQRRAAAATREFGGGLRSLRGIIAGLGVGLLAREVIRTGLAMESVTARFRTAAGGIAAGDAAMARARETAERFGLDLVAVERGFSGLLAASRGTAIEAQAEEIFEGVATAAAALQLPAEQVQGALTAIEQVMSKGKLQAEELRGQLGERIPGAFQIAARAMGVTTAELNEMLEAGEVLSDDFLPRFARQLREEFGEGARLASEGATADFNRFRNAIVEAQREFSRSGFLEGLAEGMRGVTETLRDPGTQAALAGFGRVLGDGLSFAAQNAGDLAQAIGGLVALRFAARLIGWGRAATTAATGMGVLRAAMAGLGGPVGIGLAAVSAALAALPFLIEDSDERIASLKGATDAAATSMEAYARASRQAAEDQAELGGKVRAATERLLDQSRATLQTKLRQLRAQFEETVGDILGRARFDTNDPAALRRQLVDEVDKIRKELGDRPLEFKVSPEGFLKRVAPPDLLGSVFGPLVEMLNRLEGGDLGVIPELSAQLERIAGVGDEARRAATEAVLAFEGINNVDLGDAQEQLLRVARLIGGLGPQIEAVLAAPEGEARARAVGALANEMLRLSRAGEVLRDKGPVAFRDMLKAAGASQQQIETLEAALDGTLELTEDIAAQAGEIDYSGAAASASALAGELERAGKALAALQGGLLTLDFETADLEAQIAALEGGASEAEARVAGRLARARAEIAPILSLDTRGIQGAASEQVDAALGVLSETEAKLERQIGLLERRKVLIDALTPDRGGSGGGRVRDEVDLAGKVVEEFGQRFGGTFDFAEARIEAWRQTTLENLRAAGLGHTELADMVEQIARDRLAEAYQEDLRNRDDWAAGVERGLAQVFDTQRSMADIAEEVVTDAFSGLEDAFVSLAKTGKIETEQMVDFVLRQLFRLAAQAAISNVTGAGGGGGIFGSILSAIFGGVTGVSTAASTRAAGFPPVFDGSGAIALPQLHDGGIAGRDGQTRLVDPSVFSGAKRLHVGGLARNEVPAILEEDERVLTLAQQQSTAETIRGLAALAADPGGGAPLSAAAPVINVNVIGAPAQPRVSQPRQNGDGTFDIDVVFDQIEERLAGNVARGRGIAPAIGDRFNLRGRL